MSPSLKYYPSNVPPVHPPPAPCKLLVQGLTIIPDGGASPGSQHPSQPVGRLLVTAPIPDSGAPPGSQHPSRILPLTWPVLGIFLDRASSTHAGAVAPPPARGRHSPAVAIDDPPGHHLPERLPVPGFPFHGRPQQDHILDDPLAIWWETPKRLSVSWPQGVLAETLQER